LGEENIQQWIMRPDGWEEKAIDENVSESIKIVLEDLPSAPDGNLDLELLDLAIDE
jgi:nuclear pore complex protein Nup133